MSSGSVTGSYVIQRFKYLVDLPEVATLVRGQHAKGAVHVVAESCIHGRLNSHLIDGQARGTADRLRKLRLLVFKRIPSRVEIVPLRHQWREHFEPQPVWRLQMLDKQSRERSGPQPAVR